MLDDIDPWGLEGVRGLNSVTATLLGTSIVFLLILIGAAAVLLTAGRQGGLSGAQQRGIRMMAIGSASVAVIASAAGAISWSIGIGTDRLMPEDARGQDIVVERDAPSSTCPRAVTLSFDDDAGDENFEILNEIVGEDFWTDGNNNMDVTPISAEWQPVGPECLSSNYQAEEGTDIEVVVDYGPLGGPGHETRTFCAGIPPSQQQSGC